MERIRVLPNNLFCLRKDNLICEKCNFIKKEECNKIYGGTFCQLFKLVEVPQAITVIIQETKC